MGKIDLGMTPLGADPQSMDVALPRGERFALSFGVGLALLLHAVVLFVLTSVEQDEHMAGAGGVELDAISVEVELVPARALQSTSDATTPASDIVGDLAPNEDASVARQARPELEEIPNEPEPDHTSLVRRQPEKVLNDDANRSAEPTPTEAVGATTLASIAEQKAEQGAATRSPGAIRAYANSLMRALNSNKPKGSGVRGSVRVTFSLGPDGTLDAVTIVKSSGNPQLDEAAVRTIRQATFPPPPAGMSTLQRTFVLPFQFR